MEPISPISPRSQGVGLKRANSTVTNDVNPFLRYDLGGTYDLSQLVVYNYNHADTVIPPPGVHYVQHGIKDVDITIFNHSVATDLGVFRFNEAPGTDPFTPQTIALAAGLRADSMLLTIKSNWLGDTFGPGGSLVNLDFDAVGLNEIQFFGTAAASSAVPLPKSTIPLAVMFIGLILWTRRSRGRQTAGGR